MADPADPRSSQIALIEDATRRTHLANERTQLAWWRTGLTALAVALAIGRVVPELGGSPTRWPYSVVGAGFAVYGVALIAYGNARSKEVMRALQSGRYSKASETAIASLTLAGIALGLATLALIVLD
ncbi:MAG: YidH family protein [Solirubrobacterales bacterium]